jgi:hypothetical protein
LGTLLEGHPMAKSKHGGSRPGSGRPKGERDDAVIRVERSLASKAKAIANHRGVTVAAVASELLRGPINKAYAQMLKELEAEQ